MKLYTQPEQVNNGEWFYLEGVSQRMKVKCIWNDRNNRRMETVWYLFGFLPCRSIVSYTDDCFKSFPAMNQDNK